MLSCRALQDNILFGQRLLNQVITLTPPSPGITLVVNSPASASQDLAVSSVLDVNITNYNTNALQFTDATVMAAVQSGLGLSTAVSKAIRCLSLRSIGCTLRTSFQSLLGRKSSTPALILAQGLGGNNGFCSTF